jgi:transposase
VPHEIVYDNLKSVVLGRDFAGSRFEWNPVFWDFSRYYGFTPAPHQPYRPQTKGKVESGVKYVKCQGSSDIYPLWSSKSYPPAHV